MRLGLGRKSAGRGRDRAAKIPTRAQVGGGNLDLPSQSLIVEENYQPSRQAQSLRAPLLRHWGNPSMFGTGIDTVEGKCGARTHRVSAVLTGFPI